MNQVVLPQKFGEIPITRDDLFNLGLVKAQVLVGEDEFWYIIDRFDPGMVMCWKFPLSGEFIFHHGNQTVSLLENGVRTASWLKEATCIITRVDGTVVAEWVMHQFEGAFLIKFFDWKTGRDRRLLEI